MKEFLSVENEGGLTHKFSGSQEENHIREEVNILLNNKELLKRRREEQEKLGKPWKGANSVLDDLTTFVLEQIEKKHGANEKYPRERAKEMIIEHDGVTLEKKGDKLVLAIKDSVVAVDNIGTLKKYGQYPENNLN